MVIFPWDSNGLLLGFHNSQAWASEHVHGKWDLLGIGLSHGLVFDFDDKPVAEWDFNGIFHGICPFHRVLGFNLSIFRVTSPVSYPNISMRFFLFRGFFFENQWVSIKDLEDHRFKYTFGGFVIVVPLVIIQM